MIPYGRQSISEEDIQAVVDVLRSDWLTQGPVVEQFEKAISNYCGAKYSIALSNGTAALHLACLALELGAGDILWTSPNTFVASANCALYCGATVDFVDIDPKTYNISVESLRKKLELAEQQGCLPKVVVAVHFAGQSCEMEAIAKLAKKYNFYVIEDASHAIGGKYKNKKIGGCQYSDMTIFSFHPVKLMTTGEGGMVVTNSAEFYERVQLLRTHGVTRDAALMQEQPHGAWYYEQINLGFNYRITDIQCALGFSQLKRLDDFIQKRNTLVNRYNELLKDFPVILPWQSPNTYSSWHLYVLRLSESFKYERKDVFEYLRNAGIGVQVHYIPVYRQPYFKNMGFDEKNFPHMESYYKNIITLPLYVGLDMDQQNFVVSKLNSLL